MPASEPITVLIAEDHPMTLEVLKVALQQIDGIEVIGVAQDGQTAVTKASELRPAVILMDIGMPLLDGIEATRQIKLDHNLTDTHIIMLTTHNRDADIFAALKAGADGYCLKEIDDSQLVIAIRAVNSGAAYLDPGIAKAVLRRATQHSDSAVEPLSDQETSVLTSVASSYDSCQSGICMVDAAFLQKLHRFEHAR